MEMKSCAFQKLGRCITSHECLGVCIHALFSPLVALKAWHGLGFGQIYFIGLYSAYFLGIKVEY